MSASITQPTRFCRGCRYPLDGLLADACPECGRGFEPKDPRTYRGPRPWWLSKKLLVRVGIAVVALVSFEAGRIAIGTIPVATNESWIDPVSGSMMHRVTRFGKPTVTVTISPLEKRYQELDLPHQRNWVIHHYNKTNIHGRPLVIGCGFQPIYGLSLSDGLQASYVSNADDEEIRQFFVVMTTGTSEEQEAAVYAAADKAISTWSPR